MEVFKSPAKYIAYADYTKIFLAGSIEMGKAVDWQTELTNKLADLDKVTILNPRRDDWNCVDERTQVITNNGIKYHYQLTASDMILTYNQKTNDLEYQLPTKINTYIVENIDMLQFKRNQDSFLFTDSHMMVSRKSSKTNSVGLYQASSFKNTKGICRTPCGKSLNPPMNNTILGTEFNDNHFKLYAWLLSEGSIFKRNDCNTYTIVIAQYIKNDIKVNKIRTILDELNIQYTYDNRMFKLTKDGVNFIKGFLGFEKYTIPLWIKNATSNQKKIFIQEYALGDGSIIDDNIKYIAFSKKYEHFAREFQILCYEAGISTKWREKTSGFGHQVINITIHSFSKKWYAMTYETTIKYSGTIWCPTTANGTWVAIKNGTPFITGNSSWPNTADFPPFREQVEWELQALEDADIIVMYFDPNTQSPITLLELGLFKGKAMVVCCPDGYFRKGNVDIVCEKYDIPHTNDKDLFFDKIYNFLKSLEDPIKSKIQ